ncbi:MAG: c-type cytochrome [Candidatus Latescibacteria bacterium]|nr:c-type cytochrome [Candidatus Latescibacterota bacterium]
MKATGWRWIGAVVVVGLIATVIFWGRGHDEGWSSFLQGDPKRGGRLFFDLGCAHCHAVFGHGGKVAPDLGRQVLNEHMSFAQLVGVMWNHGPAMWQKMRDSGAPLPSLAEREMGDIFAYLYVLGYMEEGGDMEKGKRVWATRGCASCHTVGGGGGAVGPDLSRLEVPADAIAWAQRMWNHAAAMEKAAAEKGIPWPEFQDGEMADLLVFGRTLQQAGIYSGTRGASVVTPCAVKAAARLLIWEGRRNRRVLLFRWWDSCGTTHPRCRRRFANKGWNGPSSRSGRWPT